VPKTKRHSPHAVTRGTSPERLAELANDKFQEPETQASQRPVEGSLTPTSGLSKESIRGTVVHASSFSPSARMRPHIGVMLSDAYTVIAEEFRSMRTRVEMGEELSPSEARKFSALADTMTKLAREEREQEKKTDPAALSDDALLEMLESAREALGSGD
jgi:hypothetical protein